MAKTSLKYGLFFFTIYGILKLLLFQFGLSYEYYSFGVFVNMLFLLLAIFLNLNTRKKELATKGEYSNLFDDIKTAMRSGAIYALLVACFSWLYYAHIDTAFLEERITERITNAEAFDFENISRESNPHGKTKEEFLADELEFSQFIFSPSTQFTFTLIGLIALAFIYSILMSAFYRKVLVKFNRKPNSVNR
jgi:hypothetical protein